MKPFTITGFHGAYGDPKTFSKGVDPQQGGGINQGQGFYVWSQRRQARAHGAQLKRGILDKRVPVVPSPANRTFVASARLNPKQLIPDMEQLQTNTDHLRIFRSWFRKHKDRLGSVLGSRGARMVETPWKGIMTRVPVPMGNQTGVSSATMSTTEPSDTVGPTFQFSRAMDLLHGSPHGRRMLNRLVGRLYGSSLNRGTGAARTTRRPVAFRYVGDPVPARISEST